MKNIVFHPKPNSITGAQPESFKDREGFVKSGHFDQHFVKNLKKKEPAGENFGVSPPR